MRLSISMKHIKKFVVKGAWIGRATVLTLLFGLLAACGEENNPDVVISPVTPASPSPNVAVSPTTPPPSPPPNATVSPTTPAASPDPTADTATAPITDVVAIVTTPDKQSLVNKQAQLTNVPVQSVIADRTFWAGPSNNQRLLVVLDEALDTGGTEKRLDINAGQTLTINGLIRRLPTTAEAQKQWGLSATEASALENEQIYLQAQQVTIK